MANIRHLWRLLRVDVHPRFLHVPRDRWKDTGRGRMDV